MLFTPHFLVGLYVVSIYNPILALPAALASHFLFDFFLPQWNPHIYTEFKKYGKISKNSMTVIILDVITAGSITLFFISSSLTDINKAILFVAGAIFAILPDITEIPYYFLKCKNKTLNKIITFEHHHQAKADWIWGNLSQLLVIIFCLWAIFQ